MAFDFKDIAKTKLDEVKAVPLPPVGTYRWVITKLPTIRDFKGNDGTEYQSMDFPIQAVAPLEDVDPSGYPGEISEIRQTLSFMFDKNDEVAFIQAQNRLKNFFEKILQCVGEDASIAEGMNASVKKQFLAPITWAPDKRDESIMRAKLGSTAPLD